VGFDGLEFHVDAATEKEGTSEDKEEAVHDAKFPDATSAGNSVSLAPLRAF